MLVSVWPVLEVLEVTNEVPPDFLTLSVLLYESWGISCPGVGGMILSESCVPCEHSSGHKDITVSCKLAVTSKVPVLSLYSPEN